MPIIKKMTTQTINVFTQKTECPRGLLAFSNKWIPETLEEKNISDLVRAIDRLPSLYKLNQNDRHGEFLRSRNKMILLTQYYLALRPSEALGLQFDDFTLIEHPSTYEVRIRGENNKVKKDRKLPVPNELMELLLNFFNEYERDFWKGGKYLFPSLRNKESHLSRYRWNEIFQMAIREAGLWRRHPTKQNRGLFTSYCLRHTRATNLLEKSNFDLWLVANVLGHGRIDVTSCYLHATSSFKTHLREVMNK